MINSIKLATALLATSLALGTYSASSASADPAPTAQDRAVVTTASETYKNEANGECLDAYGYLSTYRCDGTSEQKWTVTTWNDGTVRLKNGRTGECISDSGGSLGMASCTTSKAQSFYIKHWNDGTMRFKNQSSGQCIEANGDGKVWSSTSCDSSEAQSWS